MIEFGVNTDPLNIPHGRPDPVVLRALGLTSVRLVLRSGVFEYIRECRAAGLSVLGVLAQESGGPEQYVGWPIDFLQVGNEMEGRGESSWVMGPDEYYRLWYRVRDLFPDAYLIIGGMASGNPYRAEVYCAVEGASYLAVHPYAKTAPAARLLLRQYKELTGLPLLVSEWNRPAEEIGEFAAMLSEETAGAWWFCWSSVMVAGFGLDEHGKLEAMREVIMSLSDEAAALVKRVDLLEQQQALTVDLLARMLEGKFDAATHGADSAEALLKAISPKYGELAVRPFPVPA